MQTIKLDVKEYTGSGVAHTSLEIDGQDTGVLYLNKSELNTLVKVMRRGCQEHDGVVFEHVEPLEEEFDYDVFTD